VKIEIVQLENIRSHIKSTIPFTRGFNCLVGGLGCGKSSVLYSIDFALFGDPIGRSFDYLLREGADSGMVTIQFSNSGNTYRLTRGLRRREKGISQNFEALKLFQEDKIIASTKTDAVAEQLKAITGFDRDLWREIVWVRQEHLKELIDAAPRERQKRLDQLFGLSDFEFAWSNVAQYLRDYETEKRLLERDPDVAGREKLSLEYNQTTEEYTLLEIELQSFQEKLGAAKYFLEETEKKLTKLEEKRLAVEELKLKETQIKTNISHAEDIQKSLSERIEGKTTIIENLKQRQNSMETQIGNCKTKLREVGLPADQTLDILRSNLRDVDNQIGNLKAEQEATNRILQNEQKRLVQLNTQTENQCPLCMQSLNDQYKVSMLKRIQKENAERRESIAQLDIKIRKLQQTRNCAIEVFSNLENIDTRIEEVKNRILEEENHLKRLSKELEEKNILHFNLIRQLETLQSEIQIFDLSDLEKARTNREKAFKQYYVIESNLRTKENRKEDLLRRIDHIKERIDATQQKIERIEKVSKTIQVLMAIRDAYRSIQPKLRSEFVKVLRNFVQQVLDSLIGGEAQLLNVVVDETFTPYVRSESGLNREVSNLSGGERTLLAFAFRLGLGQLMMHSRTGHGLSMLLLDEPTENLGTEDGSISRLAEAISRFKAIEQIIAVTHSEDFAEKAGHVIVLEKEAGISKASIAKAE
jgi:DNA repair protein SbcC/Rad50